MKYLLWLLKAVIFFTLFAFALNNQRDVVVHLFFGTQWQAPLVLVVLLAFSAGVIVGIIGMVPRWWKHRKAAQRAAAAQTAAAEPAPSINAPADESTPLPPHGI
jgi:lipopolysaccharide assembly protein A